MNEVKQCFQGSASSLIQNGVQEQAARMLGYWIMRLASRPIRVSAVCGQINLRLVQDSLETRHDVMLEIRSRRIENGSRPSIG